MCRSQSNYAEAEPPYQRASMVSEKVLRLDHPLASMVLNNMAVLYQSQSRSVTPDPLLEYAKSLTNLGVLS